MSKLKNIFETAVILIITIILSIISINILYNITKIVISTTKIVADKYPTILVAIITGLLAFISVIIGKYLENRYIQKNKIREERQKIYIDFLDWLIKNLLYNGIDKNKNIVEELRKQQKYMTIYASDKVLKAWSDLKNSSIENIKIKEKMTKDETTKFFIKEEAPKIEKLILEIRKELGYKNKHIKKYDILKLYINDLKDYLE